MTVSAQEGSPFSLRCQPPDGWPKPSVYWMMQNSNGALRSINSSRMTVDPEGTLWFSNVTREDNSDDFVYACSATSLFRFDPVFQQSNDDLLLKSCHCFIVFLLN